MLTETQINLIASEISIDEVYEYVHSHLKEYQKFLKKEQVNKKLKVEDPYVKTINETITNGKIEVPI